MLKPDDLRGEFRFGAEVEVQRTLCDVRNPDNFVERCRNVPAGSEYLRRSINDLRTRFDRSLLLRHLRSTSGPQS